MLKDLHRSGPHKELGREAMSKKHMLEEEAFIQLLQAPYQLEQPIKRSKSAEIQEIISNLNPKKSSGYDLIIGKILKKLPIIGIKYLTQLFSALLLKGFLTEQWKIAQVFLILKPTTTYKFLTNMMSSISDCTSKCDLPGANTYSQNENNWE
jgi:hypothetical protein